MAFKCLNEFISVLEKEGELIRIKQLVDPVLEITEITDRISKSNNGGKALLFENTGTNFPLLINAFGSYKRICLSLGVKNLDDIADNIEEIFKQLVSPKNSFKEKIKILPNLKQISSWFPKTIKSRGKCQEIVNYNPDLSQFPILKCWPADGGRFITLPGVITKDPVSNIRNVGMYRMQVFEKDITGMHWHLHKNGAKHFNEYKKQKKKMPVAVILGGDPVYTYSATAPLPDNFDEFLFAGFLRNKKVELVKCLTQDIEVPSDVDIVIEGYVDPEEDFILEGPFGDHTGFYSLTDYYPKFHITCITHKKNAVYPATIVGVPPQEDAWIGKATERIFSSLIKFSMLPEIIDLNLPFSGVAHNLAIVKIKAQYPGHANKVFNAMWGAGQMMFNKILIVTGNNVDIHDYKQIAKYISKNINPYNNIYYGYGPLDILDHSSEKQSIGSKLSIDATESNIDNSQHSYQVNKHLILNKISEIVDINDELIKEEISLVIISIKKTENSNVLNIGKELIEKQYMKNIKFLIFVDYEIDIYDVSLITWYSCNNIDPKRDTNIIKYTNNKTSCLIIDGTRKITKKDNFQRDWPNVVISNNETIKKIDEIWNNLNVGEFVSSPSLKLKDLVRNNGPVAQ